MGINIFASNTTTMAINSAIDALGRNNEKGSRHIVIVPDRFTLSTEKEIYDRLELPGSFNIDVLTFSRLAVKVEKSSSKRFLTKEGTVMLMKKVIDDNAVKLTYFKNRNSMGFAREVFAVTASFRSSGITPEMLEESSADFPEHKKQKYFDLALLYKEYEVILKSRFSDTVARQQTLIEAIKIDETVSQSHIYVLGFNIYSQLQLSVIKELALSALSLNIAAATESGGKNKDIFPISQLNELQEYATANKIPLAKSYFFERLTPPLDVIHKEIFSLSKEPPKCENSSVRLMRQKNPYEEIKAIAREIIFRIKQGARFKDIAVVCAQENYRVCIKEIFRRFGIPFFIDEKYCAAESASAKYICALIEAKLYDFRRDKVLQFIKHPLFLQNSRLAERFENYCLKYNINYSRFRSRFLLGESQEFEEARASFVSIADSIKEKGSASEIADSLLEILPLEEPGEDLIFRASYESSARIKSLLEEIKTLLGEEEMTLEDFYSVFSDGIGGLEIALIPQCADCVFVGNTSESRFNSLKYIFVAGASEGFFPSKTAEQNIINFADMLMLERRGLNVRPNPLESNRLEQFVVADLLTKAEKIYVSCADCALTGEQLQTGEAIKELSYILKLPLDGDYIPAGMNSEERLRYLLSTDENAVYEYISGSIPPPYMQSVRQYLVEKGFGDRIEFSKALQAPRDFAEYVFGKDAEGYITKVSQLESYFNCPYLHFLRYGLRLQDRPQPELQMADIGNIIHEVLEIYFSENLKTLKTLSDEQIKLKASEVVQRVLNAEKLRSLKQDTVGQYTVKLIHSECMYVIKKLTENLRRSDFSPTYIELAFGMGKGFGAISLDTPTRKIKLRGKIDRVDICGNKVAIIDYKTGASVSGKYQDIYFGKKIQLYVYLNVFLKKGFEPAGVFYLPIRDSYRKDGESFAYVGQVEDSIETLIELDNALDSGGQSDIIKVEVKDGKIATRSKNIISRSDFRNICAYVNRLIVGAVDEIAEGNIERSPLSKSCEFCQYKNHCDMSQISCRAEAAMDVRDFLEEQ